MSAAGDIAAALAQRAEEVCRHYLPAGRRQGRYWVAGDVRGAKGRSLYVRLSTPGTVGKWCDGATGEHGDLLDLVRHHLGGTSLRSALAEARGFLALPAAGPAASAAPVTTADRVAAAPRLWTACRSIDRTHAESYLRARAIHRCRFAALRFHASLAWRGDEGFRRLPALVAAVTNDDGDITGVHRTWLDPARPAKAPVAIPRKALGRIHGLAIRFGTPPADDGASLLVGEGIETVLSVVTALPDTQAAAALSAGSLGVFAPPPDVTHLVIAADNDPEGEHAAERLARRCARAGVAATIIVPEYGDFNDDLVAVGADALAARLAPLVFLAPGHRAAR